MATPADVLKEIHRLRRFATELQKKIDQLPKKLELLKDTIAHQEKKLADAQTHLKQTKVHSHQFEVTLKATAEQIKKYEGQLNQIMSKKEYDALQLEIKHGKENASKIEDQIFQTLTDIEEETAQLPPIEQTLKQARQELAEFAKESQVRHTELSAELEKTKKQLAETEQTLPMGDVRIQYERLLRQRGDDTFSPVQKRTCLACYMEVTAQMYNEVLQGRFVLCRNCGRILYLAE